MKRLKKLIAFVVTFALVFGAMAVGFAASPFTDVKSDAPYASAVDRLYALGITQGMGDGTYGPDLPLTRAQMVTFVIRMLGLEQVAQAAASEPPAFTDIKDHWAVGYINVAKDLKITDGVGDGKFAPDANLTYGQALAFAIRALGYTDVKWGTPTLAKAVELGLTAGINLGFNDVINRGETAMVLNKALETETFRGYDANGNPVYGPKLISKVANVDTYLVVATPDVDNTVPSGQVKVEAATLNNDGTYSFGPDKLINAGTVDFNKYLGEVVKVYSPRFGNPIAVDVVTTDIKTFAITKNPAVSVSNGVYTFQDNSIGVGNIPVVIDGIKSTMSAVYGAIDVGSQVTLINNDGKPGYDYAIVTAATAGVTPYVVRNNVVSGAQYIDNVYPLNDTYGNAYKVVGAVTKATDIKAGDVIYYLPSASTPLPVIYVVRNSVTGTVSQISVSGTTTSATINGTAYVVTPSIVSSIKPGAQGTAILDKNNAIIKWTATSTPTTVTTNYGAVVASQNFKDMWNTQVAIAKTDGTTQTYNVVYANVYKAEDGTVINNAGTVTYAAPGSIVKYTVNSNGQIDTMSTVVAAPATSTTYTLDTTNLSNNALTVNGTVYYVSSSTIVLNATVDSTGKVTALAPVKLSDLQSGNYNGLYIGADQYRNLSLLILANMPAPTQAVRPVVYITGYSTVTTATSTYTVLNVLENGIAKTYTATKDLTTLGSIPVNKVCTLTLDTSGKVTALPTPVTPLNGDTPTTITIDYTVYGITYSSGSVLLDPNVVVIDATGTTPVVTGLANISSTAKVNLYTNSIGKVNLIVIVSKQ
ncbi:S-layer homology domain-containing protein [Caldanaerobacter subterraneus]|uniref:S-layer homology domain-containing protein n=1 Tax=Caldanaerobacter subterraneus TaxID=911092 RepID=A0A7Y2PKI1_9THEO|nr:S-layer homology domain-containing protein [Caldanaerobacter subterraneus]NNG65695.1 S-layer homology domain-containing protein [Caldanaerobacter subterraneus]